MFVSKIIHIPTYFETADYGALPRILSPARIAISALIAMEEGGALPLRHRGMHQDEDASLAGVGNANRVPREIASAPANR